jgi:hypothetical protein
VEFFSSIFDAAEKNLALALIVLLLLAIAWLYRDARQREREHLATAMQIAPLAAKLTTCVEILERVTTNILARSNSGGAGGPTL